MTDKIRFEDYRKLIHSLSHKAQKNMMSHGVNVEYDDLFQEFSISWLKAKAKFDSSQGIKFSTYFVNAAWRNWMQFSKKQSKGAFNLSLDDLPFESEDDSGSIHDIIPDQSVVPADEQIAAKQHREVVLSKLSSKARKVVTIVENPSKEIQQRYQTVRSQQEARREQGERVHVLKDITPRFVMKELGYSNNDRKKVESELKRLVEGRR